MFYNHSLFIFIFLLKLFFLIHFVSVSVNATGRGECDAASLPRAPVDEASLNLGSRASVTSVRRFLEMGS